MSHTSQPNFQPLVIGGKECLVSVQAMWKSPLRDLVDSRAKDDYVVRDATGRALVFESLSDLVGMEVTIVDRKDDAIVEATPEKKRLQQPPKDDDVAKDMEPAEEPAPKKAKLAEKDPVEDVEVEKDDDMSKQNCKKCRVKHPRKELRLYPNPRSDGKNARFCSPCIEALKTKSS